MPRHKRHKNEASMNGDIAPQDLVSRGEKSRIAAQGRREKEAVEMKELLQLLPFPDGIINKFDKSTAIRLATNYIRMKTYAQGLVEKSKTQERENNSVQKFKKHMMSEIFADREAELTLDALNGFLIVISKRDRNVCFVSESVEKHLGTSSTAMIGRPIRDFLHIEDEAKLRKAFVIDMVHGADLEGECTTIELDQQRMFYLRMKSHLKRNGCKSRQRGYVLVQFSGRLKLCPSLHRSGSTDCLICLCRPILPQPIIEVSVDGNMFLSRHDLDMTFTFCDPRIVSILGYEPSELIGRTAYQFHNPLDATKISSCHSNLIVKGTSVSKYYRFMGKITSWIWMQTRATVIFDKTTKGHYIVCMNYVISEEVGHRYLMLENEEMGVQQVEFTGVMDVSGSYDASSPQSVSSGYDSSTSMEVSDSSSPPPPNTSNDVTMTSGERTTHLSPKLKKRSGTIHDLTDTIDEVDVKPKKKKVPTACASVTDPDAKAKHLEGEDLKSETEFDSSCYIVEPDLVPDIRNSMSEPDFSDIADELLNYIASTDGSYDPLQPKPSVKDDLTHGNDPDLLDIMDEFMELLGEGVDDNITLYPEVENGSVVGTAQSTQGAPVVTPHNKKKKEKERLGLKQALGSKLSSLLKAVDSSVEGIKKEDAHIIPSPRAIGLPKVKQHKTEYKGVPSTLPKTEAHFMLEPLENEITVPEELVSEAKLLDTVTHPSNVGSHLIQQDDYSQFSNAYTQAQVIYPHQHPINTQSLPPQPTPQNMYSPSLSAHAQAQNVFTASLPTPALPQRTYIPSENVGYMQAHNLSTQAMHIELQSQNSCRQPQNKFTPQQNGYMQPQDSSGHSVNSRPLSQNYCSQIPYSYTTLPKQMNIGPRYAYTFTQAQATYTMPQETYTPSEIHAQAQCPESRQQNGYTKQSQMPYRQPEPIVTARSYSPISSDDSPPASYSTFESSIPYLNHENSSLPCTGTFGVPGSYPQISPVTTTEMLNATYQPPYRNAAASQNDTYQPPYCNQSLPGSVNNVQNAQSIPSGVANESMKVNDNNMADYILDAICGIQMDDVLQACPDDESSGGKCDVNYSDPQSQGINAAENSSPKSCLASVTLPFIQNQNNQCVMTPATENLAQQNQTAHDAASESVDNGSRNPTEGNRSEFSRLIEIQKRLLGFENSDLNNPSCDSPQILRNLLTAQANHNVDMAS